MNTIQKEVRTTYLISKSEFITTLKLYDEVRTLFFDGENVSPYYGNQNYPSLSNFVITK